MKLSRNHINAHTTGQADISTDTEADTHADRQLAGSGLYMYARPGQYATDIAAVGRSL